MKIRKLVLRSVGELKYADMLESVFNGASTPDEILRAVKIAAEIEKSPKVLLLDNEDYQYIIGRLEKTPWNSNKETRKALAEFFTDVRGLKEEDAKLAN